MESIVLFANKLELRYCFNDKSVYMDAVTRHKCEKELLWLIRYVAEALDVKMMIYTEPYIKEGGFSELWAIAGRNTRANSIVLNLLMHILTRPSITPDGESMLEMTDSEASQMKEELLNLQEQLKRKQASVVPSRELVTQLNTLPRIRRCKSNFYEAVKSYSKITKIIAREVNEKNRSRSGSLEVKRSQFPLFICKMSDLSDDPAIIRQSDIDKRQLSLNLFDEPSIPKHNS